MLPNLKSEASVLQKIFAAEFGLELPRHDALEITARMKGFTGYQELQKGFKTVANQLFDGNVVHITNGAGEISGEDEVCCILQKILKILYKNQRIFAIEARGYCLSIGRKSNHRSEISLSSGHEFPDIESDSRPCYMKPYGDTLNRFNVFNEVFIKDLTKSSELADEEFIHYLEHGKFQTGIIAADLRYSLGSEIQARTKFSVVHHLAVGQSYRSHSISVRNAIEKIRSDDSGALIICWLSGTDVTGRRSRALSPIETAEHPLEVDGAGFVSDERDQKFFSEVIDCLRSMDIPMIKVPYLKDLNIFTNFGANLTARMVRERDAVLHSAQAQIINLGFVTAEKFSPYQK